MDKFKAFLKKNNTVLTVLLFLIVNIVSGRVPVGGDGELSISDVVIAAEDGEESLMAILIAPVMQKALKDNNETLKAEIMAELDVRLEEIELKELSKDIDEIALSLSEVRTRDKLEELLLFWHTEKWTKKITAINSIGSNTKATGKLRELLYFFSDELFEVLMNYYK